MNRTDRDPLTAAGFYECHCGLARYPTDAAWLTTRHLLATYAACRCTPEQTQITDTAAMVPWTPRCNAGTRAGTDCRNRPLPGSRYCRVHSGGA